MVCLTFSGILANKKLPWRWQLRVAKTCSVNLF